MANELTATFGLSISGKQLLGPGIVQVLSDWTSSQGSLEITQNVGTTEETLSSTDIGTNGWVHLYNTDATNYVEWGFSTGVYGGRLKPGWRAEFYLNPSATIYLKANTAACRVFIVHMGGV